MGNLSVRGQLSQDTLVLGIQQTFHKTILYASKEQRETVEVTLAQNNMICGKVRYRWYHAAPYLQLSQEP
ncbi:hypothetical protein D3C80_2103430 [compost metagenome]